MTTYRSLREVCSLFELCSSSTITQLVGVHPITPTKSHPPQPKPSVTS